MNDLEKWMLVQDQMRLLQKAEGWDQYRFQMEQRIKEEFEDMLAEGPKAHDLHAGFIEGLRWVLNYPQFVIEQVELYREQVAAEKSALLP